VHRSLITSDGVRIRAVYSGPASPALDDDATGVVLAHGFSGSVDKERNRRILARFAAAVPAVAFDFRGHGRSEGLSTLGDREILDVEAAVGWARSIGLRTVVTVGFSMGAAVVVRHAGVVGGVDGVVAVSGPAFWNYRGTPIMRLLHFGVEHPLGRAWVRRGMGTRVIPPPWPTPWPMAPAEAAERIPPTPFLVVHGRVDPFFPDEHPRALIRGARLGADALGLDDYRPELWLEDFGHAEAAVDDATIDRIADWVLSLGRAT
jgi:pimeloyl-ACP methyl ester carboxylesterase